jgi:hypothetical protein
VTLEPGETATRTLTLANNGQSDLDWKVGFRPDVATRPTTLPAPMASSATGEIPAEALSLTAELRDLTGMHIHWDVSHGQYLPGNWPTVVSDLLVRGATVQFNSLPLTPDRLDPMDVLWIIDTADTWQEAEIRAVADWVHNGGGLLLEGDDDISVGVFNRILAAAGVTFRYGASDAQAGFTTIIHEHPATVDIASIHLSDPAARLTGIDSPARRLVDDPQGVTVAAAGGRGAVAVTMMERLRGDIGASATSPLACRPALVWCFRCRPEARRICGHFAAHTGSTRAGSSSRATIRPRRRCACRSA